MAVYTRGTLHVEEVPLEALASQYATPFYVYSKHKILSNLRRIQEGLLYSSHLVCYPVKANFNQGILSMLKRNGIGFDVASTEELQRLLFLGADPQKIVFSGPGKSKQDIAAAISEKVYCIHAESWQEVERIEEMSRSAEAVPVVGIRVNPDVDSKSHPHVATGVGGSKFGFPMEEAVEAFTRIRNSPFLEVGGVHYHIGSQVLSLQPFLRASEQVAALVEELYGKRIKLRHVDVGGGIGVPYRPTDVAPDLTLWLRMIAQPYEAQDLRVICEPGRALVAESGILLTRVEYVKKVRGKTYIICDAGMNDFIRPALYDAFHEVKPLLEGYGKPTAQYDIVGPICECADFIGKERTLPVCKQGDVLAVMNVGAYGSCMASNYNSRNLPLEILVDGKKSAAIRNKQTIEQQIANECVPTSPL